MFTLKKGFFRNVYTLKMESDSATNTPDDINLGDERIALEGEEDDLGEYPTDGESLLDDYPIDGDFDYTDALSNMEMNLTVNLPNKPISHNATSVSNNGKSLTWNLVAQQSDVELTFALYNKTNILICVAGVVVVVIVVIVVISKSSKNKNTSNNQTTNNAQNNEMMNNNTMNNNTMNNNTVDNNTMVDNTMTDSSSINNQPEVNNNPEIINNSDNVPNSNGMTNDGVNNVPADGIDGINSSNQDDIFPDNQPNNEPNNDGTPLEDLFNNYTNNNYSNGLSIYFPYNSTYFTSIYKDISSSNSYYDFITDFSKERNTIKTPLFSLNDIKKENQTNEGADFELELTDEQVENYSSAKAIVFLKNKNKEDRVGMYRPLFNTKDIKLNGNKLQTKIRGKSLRAVDNSTSEGGWLTLIETYHEDDVYRYQTFGILENINGKFAVESVELSIEISNKNPNGKIINAKLRDK